MNNRHRRVARIQKQMERKAETVEFLTRLPYSVEGILDSFRKLFGAAIEAAGESFARVGRSIQGKPENLLPADLTEDEWIALAHYIKGKLFIGGQNEGREQRIADYQSAAEKIIRIGEVLEENRRCPSGLL